MSISMTPVTGSSNVKAYGYDADSRTLAVEFHGSGTYHYEDVPPSVVDDLGKAKSVGSFFHQAVRGQFKHKAVKP